MISISKIYLNLYRCNKKNYIEIEESDPKFSTEQISYILSLSIKLAFENKSNFD